MVYVVEVGYNDFVFNDSEDAMSFARTAKLFGIDGKNVEITLYTKEEWAEKNKKED